MEKVIDISSLKKSFGSTTVFNNLDLCLYKGENLVVLGRSGSGKSVLIKCIVKLILPDSGTISVFNKDVLNAQEDELNEIRKQVGFLFQSGALYDSFTIYKNLEFTLRAQDTSKTKSEVKEIIYSTLEDVGLKEVAGKMPSELSGGMRKRIALARTIITQPKIILYDEPTTGLDTYTSEEISELIVSIREKQNTSSIIITHDIPCAKITGDRLLVLKDGKNYREGPYNELKNDSDTFLKTFFYTI
jgi:phospholipid/cholesterol/gamma-HCH transport system ATP-binding protein